ncbi:MAG: hypothetical protein GX950_00415 [Candidatus Diapherotrites archaeon]|jgi:hypothetical protein|uniref:Uncharacterized protein n=1 Tax=Candidatus Iainarchaeum sp. TaxID=3101447 RepID=A0A7K4BYB7_9ARCH|nr:hypothetical protein [Candidatus Diapherotrites archaeon]
MSFDLVTISLIILLISFLIIIVSVIILLLKSSDEKKATEVVKHLDNLRENKFEEKEVPVLEIKKDELSLKKLLIEKFKPSIEKQLKTKVEVTDFNAKGNNFLALIDVNGTKLLLVLDSSGKIIDYKKSK